MSACEKSFLITKELLGRGVLVTKECPVKILPFDNNLLSTSTSQFGS